MRIPRLLDFNEGAMTMHHLGYRAANLLSGLTPAKNIAGLAKYMYIKKVLEAYDIDLVIDVGANVGQFARSLRGIGYKGRIISFEPVASVFEQLASVSRGDAKWDVHNYALGDTAGRQTINVMADGLFSSFKTPSDRDTGEFVDGNTVAATQAVEVRTLRDVVADLGIAHTIGRTLLKCDTQGFDLHVLRGASPLLQSIPALLVELSVTQLYDGAPGYTEMLGFLETSGFAPVGLFPINRLSDWSAVEFDYLGVNRAMAAANPSVH